MRDTKKSNWILKPTKAKAIRKPQYRLQVLSDENAVANVVNIGRRGHLLITAVEDSEQREENNFSITNLTAEDTTSKKKLSLIDRKGCVVNSSIVKAISKPAKGQMRIDVHFSGFDDKAQVVYHAIVKPCRTGCFPKCNEAYYVGMF